MWTVPYLWLKEPVSPKPAVAQMLRKRGKLESIPSCCTRSWCVFLGGGWYWGGESDYAGHKVHWYLFWLLQINTWHNLRSAFSLFRIWVIFIFWSANKFWLLVVHALLILVQGPGIHRIVEAVWEKCNHFDQGTKSSWQNLGFGEMVVESARPWFRYSLFWLGRRVNEYLTCAVRELKRMLFFTLLKGKCLAFMRSQVSPELLHWTAKAGQENSSSSCFALSCSGELSHVVMQHLGPM